MYAIAGLREKIEILFVSLSRWIYQNPLKSLISVFLFVGLLVHQVPSITIDASAESILYKNDPSLIEYNRFRDQFGRAELIIIAIQSPEVFNTDFFNRLKSFHKELEKQVPYLLEVTSLINARHTYGNEDELIVEDLFAGWPEKFIDFVELEQQVLTNPFYMNHLISKDGRVTAVVIETEAVIRETLSEEQILNGFDEKTIAGEKLSPSQRYFSDKENHEVIKAINQVANQYNDRNFQIKVSGGPVINDAFGRATLHDIRLIIVLSLITVGFFLIILFGRSSGVLLPMLIILSSLFSTLGLMSLFNIPIKLTTTVIPAFLLTVSVCDAVHILAIFYRHFEQNADKEEAIVHAFRHSGLAIVLTSLTTIVALMSFSFADLSGIAEIGYFASAGVLLALVYTIVMLPAILALIPLKSVPKRKIKLFSMDKVLLTVADFTSSQRRKILCVSIAIVVIFLPTIFQVKFSHDVVRYFPDSMPYRHDLRFIDRELGGTLTLEIILDTGRKDGIIEPRLLNQIETICRKLEKMKQDDVFVGKVFCITDIIKEIHRALNENRDGYYRIPQNRNIVAQEFLLFENSGSDDLARIVDSQFVKTRITIKTPWVDAVVGKNYISDISMRLKDHFKDEGEIKATGLIVLLARAISAAIYSMAKSYAIAFVAITLIMILVLGNVKLGLLSMIPNLIPICFTMGMISFLNVPLDINSLMIGSIAIGIVVDDTVHFLYNFQKYYNKKTGA